MTKTEIVSEISKDKTVEKMLRTITKDNSQSINDLAQDIYMSLLEKNEEFIVSLYKENKLKNFISGMITRNYFSKTSPYYKYYRKFLNNSNQINEFIDDFTYDEDY